MRRDVPRRVFRGKDLGVVAEQARRVLGDDVVVLNTRSSRDADGVVIEVVAAAGADVERYRATLEGRRAGAAEDAAACDEPPHASPEAPAHSRYPRLPRVLALVGPTGAGKTTTLAKLAIHRDAFGARRTALVTLDTYRAGAVAQLETYAHVARLPFDVVYDAADAERVRERLRDADAILVDTPGRGPRGVAGEDPDAWRAALAVLAPDEVHLVLPATIRADIAEAVRERYDVDPTAHPITHLVLTKLDEVPGEEGVSELAARLALPVRWVTDGQEIPVDLVPGATRLVEALGAYGGLPSRAAARIADASAAVAAPPHPTSAATSPALDRHSDADGVGSTPRRGAAVAAVPRPTSAR
jgi:flagellar biosynthesis protein FlhF